MTFGVVRSILFRRPSADELCVCLLQKFKRDPYVTTLGGFSKVTNYLFDALRGMEEQQQRPPEEVADLLGEVIPGLEINQQEEPGFEVITRVRGLMRLAVRQARGSRCVSRVMLFAHL